MTAASWAWRRGDLGPAAAAPGPQYEQFGPAAEAAAIAGGWLPASAARMQVRDRATGTPLAGILARGSVNWNARRNAYVLIADQQQPGAGAGGGGGTPSGSPSLYGELWYCESPEITGPWTTCDRIVTHDVTGASCYNPMQLPWLDERGGAVVHLACTWTTMASGKGPGQTDRACAFDEYGGQGCGVAVPRYEYNNLVFRLDVDQLVAGRGG
jgi:hypothetical protein